MKFLVHTNEEGYVEILELTTKEEGVEIPNEVYESNDLICYKYINGVFSFDEEKKAKLEQARLNQIEIEDLRKKLADTDYIWNVIKEGDHTEEYYADVIAQRHEWRLRIRELENA